VRIESLRGETPNHFERLDTLTAVRDVFLSLLPCDDEPIRLIDGHANAEAVQDSS
jgi:thymidylate kinase